MTERPDDLDTRAWHGLQDLLKGEPVTPEAVAQFRVHEYLRLPNVGRKSAQVVRQWLGRHGLAFYGEMPVRPEEPTEPPLLLQVRKLLEEHGRVKWDLKRKSGQLAFALERCAQLEKRFLTEKAELERKLRAREGQYRAELKRIHEGPNHVIPASHSLQRAIVEMAADLASSQTNLPAFEALLAWNFDKYRAWVGAPRDPGPDQAIEPPPPSDIERRIIASGGAL